MKPLCIDLYAGLGGWAEGFLSEGYDVIGFDIERHDYGTGGYPGQLVLQDVLTLYGQQFRNAAVIVASPPCQAYSYRAMPWKRAKALPPPDNTLFDACFRIAREAGVPIVVENVKGAQPWVGRAKWHYGSYYLWGDVPALMPVTLGRTVMKEGVTHWANGETNFHQGAYKSHGLNWSDQTHRGQDFTRIAGQQAIKNNGGSWFNIGSPGQTEANRNPVHGQKGFVDGLGRGHNWRTDPVARYNSKSSRRKAASAQIAKIPFPLAQWIARCYKPDWAIEQERMLEALLVAA